MKWSDETVEALSYAIAEAEVACVKQVLDGVPPEERYGLRALQSRAALAAVAECGEVKALVEAVVEAYSNCELPRVRKALRPFTEAV